MSTPRFDTVVPRGLRTVGAAARLDIGRRVIQRVRAGADVTVGAGAAVVRDLPDGVTAGCVPAWARR